MPKVGMQPIRRQQLIHATLEAVDQVGMGDASIALIARLAGVSNGIISHYFQDKNGLIEATMRHLMTALSNGVQDRRNALRDDAPRAHLRVIIEGNFDASQVNGPAMKTWLAFWATSMHQPSQIHDARHFVDGIFAELRRRAVRRLAARFQFQPQAALVRGDDLQFRRLADDGQVRLELLLTERARTGLRVFLVNQSGENNFRFQRTRFCIRQFAQRGEHGGDGTFRVARAATVQPAIFALRNEFRSVRADGVEVRREQNGLPDFILRPQPRDEIGTSGQNFLKFNFQSGARGDGGEKIRDALFAGDCGMARLAERRDSRWAAR